MKLKIDGKQNNPILPRAVEPLLADADAADLRVLVYAALRAADGEDFEAKDAAEALALTEGEVRSSVKFWRGAGLLGASRRPAADKAAAAEAAQPEAADAAAKTASDTGADKPLRDKRPMHLNSAELCRVAKENADFPALLHAAQQTAGWIFNESEIEIIAVLYASLRLPGEFILSLIGYFVCKKEMPLRYVEKVAYDLCDKGITTPEALEEWLRRREERETNEGFVRRLFGLGQRALTEKEHAAVDSWFNLCGYGEDMVRAAYEKTVNTIGKASIAYASSILRAWHEAGYKTPADVEAAGQAKRAKPAAKGSGKQPQSFDTEDFFEKALRRSYSDTGDKS